MYMAWNPESKAVLDYLTSGDSWFLLNSHTRALRAVFTIVFFKQYMVGKEVWYIGDIHTINSFHYA